MMGRCVVVKNAQGGAFKVVELAVVDHPSEGTHRNRGYYKSEGEHDVENGHLKTSFRRGI